MSAANQRMPEILIVGGAPADAEVLARRLNLRRFKATTKPRDADAKAILHDETPDLILLEVGDKHPNSFAFISDVRHYRRSTELPIIALAPDDDRRAMIEAINRGANDFAPRSIDFDMLLARITAQINVRAEFRRAISEQARLQRRLETRARMEERGYGDPQRRVSLMNELHRGILEGQVTLSYQPQLRLRSGQIGSAEALVRWVSPTLGAVSPDNFIPLAEETGDIAALTDWVVSRAITDHEKLAAAGHHVTIAINLSAGLAGDSDFVGHLLTLLAPHPNAVSLELTESAIFEDPELAIENLRRFTEAGVRIAIDDYGTGMSSLSYIQRLPVQELKIDRMFISNLTKSHRDPLLVRSTIELAHALDFEVVAEGVEDPHTLALLAVMGCDLAQGYHIGRPMGLEDLSQLVADPERRAKLNPGFDAESFLRDCLDEHERAAG